MKDILTNGCELTTAITNIFIALTSLICFIKIKKEKKDNVNIKLWLFFFFFILIDGILGVIIHGFVLNKEVVNILWIILSFFFTITINLLVSITLYEHNKKRSLKYHILLTIILSLILYSVLLTETLIGIDFLLTFIIYAALALVFISIIYIKAFINKKSHIKYYLLGIILQIIGGIFLLYDSFHLKIIVELDKNGIYHLFMVGTIIMYYIGIKNNKENEFK